MKSTPVINDLSGHDFVVKPYQRGYKWTTREVVTLLDDIHGFRPTEEQREYCIQPIAVRNLAPESSDCWELIDGQQRLTTIFLILCALGDSPFSIRYKTRPISENYLSSKRNDGLACRDWNEFCERHPDYNNVDIHHFFNAQVAIRNWLDSKTPNHDDRMAFQVKLLSQVFVIWYEPETNDKREIFRNLNVGKIQLTDAELIKAHLLKMWATTDRQMSLLKQIKLASEWDAMEMRLRDPQLWSFLNPDQDYTNRIEYVFRITSGSDLKISDSESPFSLYYSVMCDADASLSFWEAARKAFRTIQEWLDDDEVFHWVGYLRQVGGRGKSITELLALWKLGRKSAFKQELLKRVIACLPIDINASPLTYPGDNVAITHLLLFFNIQTLRRRRNGDEPIWLGRFRFDLYKAEDWSLEHIHAQNEIPRRDFRQLARWLAAELHHRERMNDDSQEELAKRYKGIDQAASLDAWNAINGTDIITLKQLTEVAETLGSGESNIFVHGLDNMALLSKDLNSSLGNGYFDEKRVKVISFDREGRYLLPATKHVFLKYYSSSDESLFDWTQRDRKMYVKAIDESLVSIRNELRED